MIKTMIFVPSNPGFYEQDQTILALLITGYLVAVGLVVLAIYSNRAKLERAIVLLTKPFIVKAVRLTVATASIAAFAWSFVSPGANNLEMGGLALLFFFWPVLGVQAVIGFLPLEKKIHAGSGGAVLLATYVIVSYCIIQAMVTMLLNAA